MNIIKTDIIDPATDVFWSAPGRIDAMTPKPVLILVSSYAAGSAEEGQMQKMLDACKLTPGQYNLLTMDRDERIAWYHLKERLNPEKIFMPGITPAQLGISALFRAHTLNHFDGCTWLPTLSLPELEQHKEIKSELWHNGMKPLFAVQ